MRVLVTGGTGFVGGAAARRLRADGHAVRLFARPGDRAQRVAAEGFEVVTGDVPDPEAVDRAVAGQDAVLHLAANYRAMGEYLALAAAAVGARPPRIHLPLAPLRLAAVVCELAGRALRREPPLYRRRLNFFRDDRAFLIDRARRVLGFEPMVELPEGLARTVAWSRAQGLL